MQLRIATAFVFALATRTAFAEPSAERAAPAKTAGSTSDTERPSAERKALMRQLRDEREKMVKERGEIFAGITTKHDYTGEHVLFRDHDVTAFLDIKDPEHPRYKPGRDEDDKAPSDPSKRRAHILVVPNEPRETIGKTLASDITTDDLEVTLKIMREASTLATRFGVKNAKIYIKSPERVGVGYLHVHIVGERDPKVPYPRPLK